MVTPPPPPEPAQPDRPIDAVEQRRAQIAGWVHLGKRIGYLALAIALAVFTVALAWGLPEVLVGVIIACLVIASITLLPSIVFGYGVSAAARDDRDAATRAGPSHPPDSDGRPPGHR